VLPNKIIKIRFVGQSTQDQLEIHLEDSVSVLVPLCAPRTTIGDTAAGSDVLRSSPRLQAMRNAAVSNRNGPLVKKLATKKRKIPWGEGFEAPC
jgi:hypothetical protein